MQEIGGVQSRHCSNRQVSAWHGAVSSPLEKVCAQCQALTGHPAKWPMQIGRINEGNKKGRRY